MFNLKEIGVKISPELLGDDMFLTRWLCVAEQQVHIWTEEAAGSGCRAKR